jgi:hypothetical protein
MKTRFSTAAVLSLFLIAVLACQKPDTNINPTTGAKTTSPETVWGTLPGVQKPVECFQNIPIKLLTRDVTNQAAPIGISLSGAANNTGNSLPNNSGSLNSIPGGITTTDLAVMTQSHSNSGGEIYIVNKNGSIRYYLYALSSMGANWYSIAPPTTGSSLINPALTPPATTLPQPLFINSDKYVFPMGNEGFATIGKCFNCSITSSNLSFRYVQIVPTANTYTYSYPDTSPSPPYSPITISNLAVIALFNPANPVPVKFVLQSPNYISSPTATGEGKIIVIKTDGTVTELIPDVQTGYKINASLGTISNIASVVAVSPSSSYQSILVAKSNNEVLRYSLNANGQFVSATSEGIIDLGKIPCPPDFVKVSPSTKN